MKTFLTCLREFEGLKEGERSSYMQKHAAFLLTYISVWGAITHNNVVVKAAADLLSSLLAVKDLTDAGQSNYDTQYQNCVVIMVGNYDSIDELSFGNGTMIEKAGIKATSTNTTRIGKPVKAAGTVAGPTGTPKELKVKWDMEKLSVGAVVISSASKDLVIEVLDSGCQMSITMGGETAMINIATGHNTIVKGLVGATLVESTVALFNANGMSPIVSTPATVVPNV